MANETTALIIHAFDGDQYGPVANRAPNEIVLTAYGAADGLPVPLRKEDVAVTLLAPSGAGVTVTQVERDGRNTMHIRFGRFENTPAINPGVYLFEVNLDVNPFGSSRGMGTALATARLDENLPVIPDPGGGGGEDP